VGTGVDMVGSKELVEKLNAANPVPADDPFK
jgi:hypothetical protein